MTKDDSICTQVDKYIRKISKEKFIRYIVVTCFYKDFANPPSGLQVHQNKVRR